MENHRCIYENRGCRKGRRRICPYPYRISDRRMALQNGDHKRAYRESENRRLVRRQRYLPVILWRRRKRRSTMFLWIRREKSAGHQAHSVRPDAHAIEVLTEQPRRAGDFPAQEDRMLGWRWNLAGMFGKRQTARRKKRGEYPCADVFDIAIKRLC